MRQPIHYRILLLTLCVVLSACAVKMRRGGGTAGAPLVEDTAQGALWRQPTRLDLLLKQERSDARWRFLFAGDGMLKLDLLDAASGAPKGELILVSGHLLLTRAVNTTRDDVLEYVEDAMLSQQIATALLQQAFPAGPARVTATHKIKVEDVGQSIAAETIQSSRVYYPPWTLRGNARRVDADSIEYEMTFIARTNSSVNDEVRLVHSGTWRREAVAPMLPDEFSLSGWSAWRIRVGTRAAGGGLSTAGYITTPEGRRYQTIGELRAATPR